MAEQKSAHWFSGEEGPDTWENSEYWEDEKTLQLADERARSDPEFDFFAACRPRLPKETIGRYVKEQGFNVPLIDTREEWEAAFDADEAVIRSDMPQDYDGLSGLLSSICVGESKIRLRDMHGMTPDFRLNLEELLRKGLRSTQISPSKYMRRFVWPENIRRVLESANAYGVRVDIEDFPQASLWRYVLGTNLLIFKDPAVDGRYHMRTRHAHGYVSGWQLDPEYHDEVLKYDYTHSLVPRPILDFYEAVRTLYKFDVTQVPAVEAQLDGEGTIHFLQYLRTGLKICPVDSFPLPSGPDLIKTSDVRGATDEGGEELRLYIAPRRITAEMKGQAFYLGFSVPYDRLGVQLMSMYGRVVVHNVYISLKDNHWDSSPMLRPPVAMGLGDCTQGAEWKKKLEELTYQVYRRGQFDSPPPDQDVYVNVRITANGRDATIESDWQPHFVAWQ